MQSAIEFPQNLVLFAKVNIHKIDNLNLNYLLPQNKTFPSEFLEPSFKPVT